jgi:hypothetical protein
MTNTKKMRVTYSITKMYKLNVMKAIKNKFRTKYINSLSFYLKTQKLASRFLTKKTCINKNDWLTLFSFNGDVAHIKLQSFFVVSIT